MMERIKEFLSESRSELKRVNWPSQEQMRNLTYVVLVTLLILGVFLYVVDRLVYLFLEITIFSPAGIGASAMGQVQKLLLGQVPALLSALGLAGDLFR